MPLKSTLLITSTVCHSEFEKISESQINLTTFPWVSIILSMFWMYYYFADVGPVAVKILFCLNLLEGPSGI
ncbi:hypothetical protein GL2_32040 [Microbulbifer sp. GL-2]|nr:hypothetical protein GL2_32040 [Microbulbifer sp. GL-2]